MMSSTILSICYTFHNCYVDIYYIEMTELRYYRETETNITFQLKMGFAENSLYDYHNEIINEYNIPKKNVIFHNILVK